MDIVEIEIGSKAAWIAQHAAIWGSHTWPLGTVVSITAQAGSPDKAKRGQFGCVGFVPVLDAEAAWLLIEREARKGHNTWVSVGGMNSSVVGKPGRGKRRDILGLPALFVDIDFRSGQHSAAEANPSREEGMEWVDAGPTPTVLVQSGGGVHVWLTLSELLDPTSPEGIELLERHKSFWIAQATAAGRSIDAGVLADAARVLRPVSTWNSNQNAPVTLSNADGPVYTIAQLLAFYPPLPVAAKAARRSNAGIAQSDRTNIQTATNKGDRPGDRFALAVPADDFLVEVFGAEDNYGYGVSMPTSNGELSPADSARTFPGDAGEPTKITFFSATCQAAFGIQGDGHSWTSFDLLANSVGGYARAAKLAARAENNGTWPLSFFDTIRESLLPQVADAFYIERVPAVAPVTVQASEPVAQVQPAPSLQVVIPPLDAREFVPFAHDEAQDPEEAEYDVLMRAMGVTVTPGTTVAHIEPTIATVIDGSFPGVDIATMVGGVSIDLENQLVAHIYSDGHHGIYQKTFIQDPISRQLLRGPDRRLTTWVAFKSQETEQFTVDPDGNEIEAAEMKVQVTIATSRGIVRSRDGFTGESAMEPKTITRKLNVGVSIPVSTSDKAHVANSINELGAHGTGTKSISSYGTLGWLRTAFGVVYLAPGGSVTAKGIAPEYTVGAPPRSSEGALTPAQKAIGWHNLPETREEMRAAAASIPAFLSITPANPAAFAVLGMMLAAPLALTSRGTVFLGALPGSGKTILTGCAQAFITGDASAISWTGGDIGSATIKGAGIAARWARHSTSFWDDYRVPKDDSALAARMLGVVRSVLQAGYGASDSGQKSTVDGGLMDVVVSETAAIMTGEALMEEEGILSRAVSIEIKKGDIHLTPTGSSPVDTFRAAHATGAHEIYGRYIQWLAARIQSAGGLKDFRAANSNARLAMTPEAGRSAQVAAVLALGWNMFRMFAIENGFPDLVPTATEIKTTTAALAVANGELVRDSNPAQSIIRAARDQIAAKNGHLETHTGEIPPAPMADSLGWTRARANLEGFQGHYERSRSDLGILSDDGQWVLLRSAAVTDIKRRLGMAMPIGQINGGFAALVCEGTTPGDRAPRALASFGRARGYVLPASLFDLGELHVETDGAKAIAS